MSDDQRGNIITTRPTPEGTDVQVTDVASGHTLGHRLVHDDFVIVTAGEAYWAGTAEAVRRDGYVEHVLRIRVPAKAGEPR